MYYCTNTYKMYCENSLLTCVHISKQVKCFVCIYFGNTWDPSDMGLRAENYINLRKKFNVKGDAFALNEYLLLKRKYTKRGGYV